MKIKNKNNIIEYGDEEEIEEEENEEEELEARMWAEECERAKTNAFYDANRSLL